jgi:hypothetical protein
MTFLSLLKEIPKNGEISPAFERKLTFAAYNLLAGRDGHLDLGEMRANAKDDLVEYGDYDALEDLSEPDTIEDEEAELSIDDPDSVDDPVEENLYESYTELYIINKQGRKITIFRGPHKMADQIRDQLDLIHVRQGRGACQRKIRELRETYLGLV